MPVTVKYPDALRQQAIALHQQGKGYKAIAQKHGLNYNNLRNYLLHNHPESALLHAYAKKSAKERINQRKNKNEKRIQAYIASGRLPAIGSHFLPKKGRTPYCK